MGNKRGGLKMVETHERSEMKSMGDGKKGKETK